MKQAISVCTTATGDQSYCKVCDRPLDANDSPNKCKNHQDISYSITRHTISATFYDDMPCSPATSVDQILGMMHTGRNVIVRHTVKTSTFARSTFRD